MTPDWRGPVNQLLYSLVYSAAIGEEMMNFNGDNAVNYTTLDLGPEVYHEAIQKALTSGEHLDGLSLLPQFDQEGIAGFLRGISARLDELRPWRDPEVRRLDVRAWDEHFEHAAQIARLDASVVDVTDVLQKGFRPAGDSHPGQQVLLLRLRTGETVALLGSPGLDEKVVLLSEATSDPVEVVEHFISATGFPAGKVLLI